jgi:hypothetical protein
MPIPSTPSAFDDYSSINNHSISSSTSSGLSRMVVDAPA